MLPARQGRGPGSCDLTLRDLVDRSTPGGLRAQLGHCSRYGGDEFVVLLSEVAHSQDAALSAHKILASVRTAHRIEHKELYVTVSMGIAVFPDDGTHAAILLKNADMALLDAKALGRGNHQFFEPRMNSRGG